jgi:hypothetical protein
LIGLADDRVSLLLGADAEEQDDEDEAVADGVMRDKGG